MVKTSFMAGVFYNTAPPAETLCFLMLRIPSILPSSILHPSVVKEKESFFSKSVLVSNAIKRFFPVFTPLSI